MEPSVGSVRVSVQVSKFIQDGSRGVGRKGSSALAQVMLENVNIGLLSTYLARNGRQVEGVVGDSIRQICVWGNPWL